MTNAWNVSSDSLHFLNEKLKRLGTKGISCEDLLTEQDFGFNFFPQSVLLIVIIDNPTPDQLYDYLELHLSSTHPQSSYPEVLQLLGETYQSLYLFPVN